MSDTEVSGELKGHNYTRSCP